MSTVNDIPSSCELPVSVLQSASGSRIMRFQDAFRWAGVSVDEYKSPANHWCGVSRQVFIGECGEQTRFDLRYFEIEPGGFSSLESHQHEHVVFVLRGGGRVQLGEELHEVGCADVVYVAPDEVHQFRNPSETEPFGFLCIVDSDRDRPKTNSLPALAERVSTNTNHQKKSRRKMAPGKWISKLSPDMPLAKAARRILEVRLGVVRDRIAPAVNEPETDVEHVHQLRVSTRRAGAALELLAGSMSKKKQKWIAKRLRKIRRAAGPARDWDVFLQSVAKHKSKAAEAHLPGYEFLQGFGHANRVAAYEQLKNDAAHKRFDATALLEAALKAIDEHESADEIKFGASANRVVSELLQELETAAAKDPNDIEHLHQVRIHGKQLRYAMELFAGCFPAAFRERLYPAIEDLQEILGSANDSYVAIPRLESIIASTSLQAADAWPRLAPGIEGYLEYHRQRLTAQQQQFIEWWNVWTKNGLSEDYWSMLETKKK